MNPPPRPADGDYQRLAEALLATGLVTDPWVDGQPRFASRPLALPARAGAAAVPAPPSAWQPPSTRRRCRWRPSRRCWTTSSPSRRCRSCCGPARRRCGTGSPAPICSWSTARTAADRLLRAERRHAQRAAGGGAAGSGHRRAGRARSQPRAGGPLRPAAGRASWARSTGDGRDRAADRGHRLPDGDRRGLRPDPPLPALVPGARPAGGAGLALQPAAGAGRAGGPVRNARATCSSATTRPTGGASGCRSGPTRIPTPIPIRWPARWRCCCRRSPPAAARWSTRSARC